MFQLIAKGNIHEAINLINLEDYILLDEFSDEFFELKIQQFIELIRKNEVEKALNLLQENLYDKSQSTTKREEMLKECLQLLLFATEKERLKFPVYLKQQRLKVGMKVNFLLLSKSKSSSLENAFTIIENMQRK